MGKLLRNSKLNVLDISEHPTLGKTYRLADPEAHVGRLAHFSSGIGVNLLSDKFTDKGIELDLYPGSGHPIPTEGLWFRSHDEAFDKTSGEIDEADIALFGRNRGYYKDGTPRFNRDGTPRDPGFNQDIFKELRGRNAYFHNVQVIPSDFPEYKNEYVGRHQKAIAADDHEGVTNTIEPWGAYQDDRQSPSDFKDTLNVFRARINEFHRNRQVKPEVLEAVNHALANPVRDTWTRNNYPEMYSSQFIKVMHPEGSDVIDTKTGTWAKIHPEGYFPD